METLTRAFVDLVVEFAMADNPSNSKFVSAWSRKHRKVIEYADLRINNLEIRRTGPFFTGINNWDINSDCSAYDKFVEFFSPEVEFFGRGGNGDSAGGAWEYLPVQVAMLFIIGKLKRFSAKCWKDHVCKRATTDKGHDTRHYRVWKSIEDFVQEECVGEPTHSTTSPAPVLPSRLAPCSRSRWTKSPPSTNK